MKKVRLDALSTKISSGITPSRKNPSFWTNGTVPWLKTEQLGVKNIYETNEKCSDEALKNTSLKLNPINTVSMAMYGEGRTRGSVSILRSEMTTNQACCNIQLDENKADCDFVFYCLSNQYENLRALSSGVRKNLNSADIKGFEISIPESLATQKKIATVLSTLDGKIELNNRINAELEGMAKLLYDYWFVQFEFPITAEQAAAMGKPHLEGKPYKSSGGPMTHNPTLKRDIPEGWEVSTINEVAEIKAGGDKPKIFSDIKTDSCSIPIYANGTTNEGLYGFTDKAKINTPSVTISARGSIGFTVLRHKPFTPIIRLIVITPYASNYRHYSYEFIKGLAFGKSGSVQQQLTAPQVASLNILKPANHTLDKYSEIAIPMTDEIEKLKEQNQHLTSLRDWLLPMLMNGQVSVK